MIRRFFTNSSALVLYILLIGLIVASLQSMFSKSDESLKEEEVTSKIKLEEFRYRDELTHNFQQYLKDSNLKKLDSLAISNKEYLSIKKFLIQDFLIKQKSKIIRIYSPKRPFFTISYDSIKTEFHIKNDIINEIESSINNTDRINDILRYGNIISIDTNLKSRINYDVIAILISGLLLLKLIIDFIIGVYKSRNEKISYEEFANDIKATESTSDDIPEKSDDIKNFIKNLKDKLNDYKQNLEPLLRKTDCIHDTKIEAYKLERISKQFYERSNLLLIIAFIIALAGILIFYFILPEFEKSYTFETYLAISLRPILTLIFFQTLSFFIFKQYRTSVSDYKYFNSLYEEKRNTITAYKLLKEEAFNQNQLSAIKEYKNSSQTQQINDEASKDDYSSILQQIKSLISKD